MRSYKVNIKFLALGFFFLILGILLRLYYLNFNMKYESLEFWAGAASFSFVFFFFVGFSEKDHVWWKLVILAVLLILFNFLINHQEMDMSFLCRSSGVLFGMSLVSISFIRIIKKWLVS
jgi:hypothetical protein